MTPLRRRSLCRFGADRLRFGAATVICFKNHPEITERLIKTVKNQERQLKGEDQKEARKEEVEEDVGEEEWK